MEKDDLGIIENSMFDIRFALDAIGPNINDIREDIFCVAVKQVNLDLLKIKIAVCRMRYGNERFYDLINKIFLLSAEKIELLKEMKIAISQNNIKLQTKDDEILNAVVALYEIIIYFESEIFELIKQDDKKQTNLLRVCDIQTNGTEEQILNFWLKLQNNNEKGVSYWDSEEDITHFVKQNFNAFQGVPEIKRFKPNMNMSELSQVTWRFYKAYGLSKGKKPYAKMLIDNFYLFADKKEGYVYSNIKDNTRKHLNSLFKDL